jgi:hypothetical protein
VLRLAVLLLLLLLLLSLLALHRACQFHHAGQGLVMLTLRAVLLLLLLRPLAHHASMWQCLQ